MRTRHTAVMLRAVVCLFLLAAVYGSAWALPNPWGSGGLAFDVTVTGGYDSGLYEYKFTASIPDGGSGEDVYGWFLTGAYGIDPGSIWQTGSNGYHWEAGEVIDPGSSPSTIPAAGLKNNTSLPVIWWVQSDLDPNVSGTEPGIIGEFGFTSSKPPMSREWLAHSDGTSYLFGPAEGPTPELSPLLLLLGQGMPLVGFLAWKRRRRTGE